MGHAQLYDIMEEKEKLYMKEDFSYEDGIKIAELETAYPSTIFNNKLHDPFNISTTSSINGHGVGVLECIAMVCPDADLYSLPSGIVSDSFSCTGTLIDEALPFIQSENIDVVNASFLGVNNPILNNKIKSLQDNAIFTAAVGNVGQYFNPFAISEVWISVGAINPNMEQSSFSLEGKEIDCVSFGTWEIQSPKNDSYYPADSGTSFAAPIIAGMFGLVQEFFQEETGKKLTQSQMYKFMKDNCRDLGIVGCDSEYGNGFLVLPNPDSIDIKKYIGDDNMTIKMQVGSKNYTVDGVSKLMDQPPIIDKISGRTLIPLRVIAEVMGAEVDWDGKAKTITITRSL
jgi:hypothetical protein